MRYLARRRDDGIGLELVGNDGAALPPAEDCGNVVVAGLDGHEALAREAAEVHFAEHPTRSWVIVWAVSDSSLTGGILGGAARARRMG